MKKITLLFAFFLAISSLKLYAGAWTKEKGKGYQQLSFTYLKYSSLLNGTDEKKKTKREVTDFTVQYYLEYGITDRLNVIAVAPFKMLQTGEDLLDVDPEDDILPFDTATAGELNGISNLTIGLKYRLVNKNYVLSSQLRIGTATFDVDDSSGLRTGYDSWLITPTLLFGKGWNSSYMSSELGYQFKTNGYADNLIANLELGKKISWFNTQTWLVAVFDAVVPLDVGTFNDGRIVHTGMFQNGEGWVSPGLKINHFITKKFIINFAGYGAFWADHGGSAPTLNFGLAYEW